MKHLLMALVAMVVVCAGMAEAMAQKTCTTTCEKTTGGGRTCTHTCN